MEFTVNVTGVLPIEQTGQQRETDACYVRREFLRTTMATTQHGYTLSVTNAGALTASSFTKKNRPQSRPIRSANAMMGYMQPGNLNDPMRVLQLKVPLVLRYSLVYQNVQSSTGSIAMAE